MSLSHALLLDPYRFPALANLYAVWLAVRTDGVGGSGTANDPYDASTAAKFDGWMSVFPAGTLVNLGPGVFQTNGYADGVSGGWQAKAGMRIVGAGIDVTTLKLVGAATDNKHYHAISHALDSGTSPTPAEFFEVSDLTVDCNLEGQSSGKTACGAVRVMGRHCLISRVKAVNWGSKVDPAASTQPAFVFAALTGTVAGGGSLTIGEYENTGIEQCIAVEPTPGSRQAVTAFHVGNRGDNTSAAAQPFGKVPYIRNCFVDCQFKLKSNATTYVSPTVYVPSAILTAEAPASGGTGISGNTGTFLSKRAHNRVAGEFALFAHPNNPNSKWNGYFPIQSIVDAKKFTVDLSSNTSTDTDSSLVICGVEYRGLSANSCRAAHLEGNQVHNTWIGGPHQDALNSKETIVRGNTYKNVVTGPWLNLGSLGGTVSGVGFAYGAGIVTVTTGSAHNLFPGLWIYAYVTGTDAFNGFRQVSKVVNGTTFEFAYSGASQPASGMYQPLWGIDKLLIEGNVIELMDLDTTEYAAPNAHPQTGRRPIAILINDTPAAGPLNPAPATVHGDVVIRRNKILYLDGASQAATGGALAGIALQVAGAKNLHVTDNIVEAAPANPLQAFRCANVKFTSNRTPSGVLIPGLDAVNNTQYSELETEAEDALVLSLL
jgi:hypothetical protein